MGSVAFLTSASPFILGAIIISMLSMCGFVFLSGWVTKEAILGACVNSYSGTLMLILFYFGLALTTAYSLRLTISFAGSSHQRPHCSILDSPSRVCKAPVLALVLGAVSQGSICWSSSFFTFSFMGVVDMVLVFFVFVATLVLV